MNEFNGFYSRLICIEGKLSKKNGVDIEIQLAIYATELFRYLYVDTDRQINA